MRYLVTGGAGFIGSHLVERLVARGDAVTVLDDLSTGSIRNLAGVATDPRLSFVEGDVRDPATVEPLVDEVDAIVHLASVVGVRRVVQRPVASLVDNVRGGETLLRAAARRRLPTLISSTSEVYGRNSDVPLTETSPTVIDPTAAGRWTYGASKAVVEMLAFGHHRTDGLPVVVARLFNTVGARQTGEHGMVLPRFVRQALDGEDLTVHGDGTHTRCFCHVSDVTTALLGLLACPAAVGATFNVGGAEEVSIRELADLVIARTVSSSGIRSVPHAQAYGVGYDDIPRRVPDTRRIRALLGWSPTRQLATIVDEVVQHTRAAQAHRAGGPKVPGPDG